MDWNDLYLLSILAIITGIEWSDSTQIQKGAAQFIASLAHQVSAAKRKRTSTHLKRLFGGSKSEADYRALVATIFLTFWQDVFELADLSSQQRVLQAVPIGGLDHLREALEEGRGAILLEPSHFGQRHRSKKILHAHGFRLYQLHAHAHFGGLVSEHDTGFRRKFLRPAIERRTLRFVEEIIYIQPNASLAFTRRLFDILHQNGILCLSGEGRQSQKRTEFEILGETREFASGAFSLAKVTGAPVLPLFCWRTGEGLTQIVIEPPLELERGMQGYISLLGSYIQQFPDQYAHW
jgi:lauroyl/myristoyl acyltransferase